jgi:hypothetical protein
VNLPPSFGGPGSHTFRLNVTVCADAGQRTAQIGATDSGAGGGETKGVCTHVSFNRSYESKTPPYSGFELPLVHFLEEHGYDVSYTTDADTDANPPELLRHRLVVTAGHSEYWTKTMRDAFERARALGTNLAFMGVNTGYWQMRYADDRRTIVEYRGEAWDPEPNPALKTVRFRSLVPPRPECELLGVAYHWDAATGTESIGGPFDYSVVPDALTDPWFTGTGFTATSTLPRLVGYEWDVVTPGCPTPPLTVLFRYQGPPVDADAVRYTAPSGARVFSAGSLNLRARPRRLPVRGWYAPDRGFPARTIRAERARRPHSAGTADLRAGHRLRQQRPHHLEASLRPARRGRPDLSRENAPLRQQPARMHRPPAAAAEAASVHGRPPRPLGHLTAPRLAAGLGVRRRLTDARLDQGGRACPPCGACHQWPRGTISVSSSAALQAIVLLALPPAQ